MLNSIIGTEITLTSFFICTAVSLLLGAGTAFVGMFRTRCTQSFLITLIIMLVNGNIGAGVAVAGTFSLVRFRSAPGNAREISSIFLAMAIGLATGMGYVALAALFFVIMAAVLLFLSAMDFGQAEMSERILKITIPENLDYEGLFDDLFEEYTKNCSLEKIRTSNMGTLYELQYHITLKGSRMPKEFLDALRCRNGNLNIVCGREESKELL